MTRAPVFVKIEESREISELFDKINKKVAQAKELLAKVIELKNQEHSEIETWKREMEDVKERMTHVDNALPEPEV